jgi:hypothetical protein
MNWLAVRFKLENELMMIVDVIIKFVHIMAEIRVRHRCLLLFTTFCELHSITILSQRSQRNKYNDDTSPFTDDQR